jgi:DNA-binding response OmpR family regulator
MFLDHRIAKVLIAENDRTVAELLRIRLDVAGYQTSLVRSGSEVLEAVRSIRPEVLILELGLPDVSGFEILRLMQLARLQVATLVIGRDIAPADLRRAVELGARDVMLKPFSGAQPLERVARLLKPPPMQPTRQAA